jgi:hypothetical protein
MIKYLQTIMANHVQLCLLEFQFLAKLGDSILEILSFARVLDGQVTHLRLVLLQFGVYL